ncbi:MAG: hypothetical protein AABY87_12465 [bacterium]
MKILPFQTQNILRIYRNSSRKGRSFRNFLTLKKPAYSTCSDAKDDASAGRMSTSEEGRREQIRKEIISEIIKKIRIR